MAEKNIIVTRGIPRTPSVSGSGKSGYSSFNPGGAGHYGDDHHANDNSFAYMDEWESREIQIKSAYRGMLQTLPQRVETDLAVVRALAPAAPNDPIAALSHELAVRDSLIAAKSTEAHEQEKLAMVFFGSDPSNKTVDDWMRLYNAGRDPAKLLVDWTASISAAYTAKFIREEISLLTGHTARLIKALEEAQAAAAELKRNADLALRDAEERASRKQIPVFPPDVSLDSNLEEAKSKRDFFSNGGSGFLFSWFYKKVRNKGDWDYKQLGGQYQEFGNFNYGVVGTAAGFSEEVLLMAAGAAQSLAGTSKKEYGEWWADTPYGDDPVDQVWVRAGIEYAKSKGF